MFIKLTASGPRRYVQLVEAYRDEAGRPKQRTLATLGRADRLGELDGLINGLLRATGRGDEAVREAPAVEFDSALALGDVWALSQLWQELGFDELGRALRHSRHEFDVMALLRAMVFNRLCDATSKLGVLRWLQTVSLPGVDAGAVTHQQLLRTMDAIESAREAFESALSVLLRPLIDQDLSVVFYDLTTVGVEGATQVQGDVRARGRAKSGLIERQFVLSLVQTAEGLPIAHEVHPGNVAEGATLLPAIRRLIQRYPVSRVVLVADRGLLSLDNLEQLRGITLPSGRPLEYVLAVPAARYREFAEIVAPMHAEHANDTAAWVHEAEWNGLRLAVAHDPQAAAARTAQRQARLQELHDLAAARAGKLDEQEGGRKYRGRALSDSGVKARFFHAVQEASLGHVVDVDLHGELFSYSVREQVLQCLQMLDGKLLVVTNSPEPTAQGVIERYKSLADIERGFHVLKSDIEIGPVYHRLPKRIRAHAAICFMALILQRVMRQRLKAAGSALSPDHALQILRRVQQHRVRMHGRQLDGVSRIDKAQLELFSNLGVSRPGA
jgi:hypothetical protein